VTIKFSWLPTIACRVQLNEPVIKIELSMIRNLWCMRCGGSLCRTWTPVHQQHNTNGIVWLTVEILMVMLMLIKCMMVKTNLLGNDNCGASALRGCRQEMVSWTS